MKYKNPHNKHTIMPRTNIGTLSILSCSSFHVKEEPIKEHIDAYNPKKDLIASKDHFLFITNNITYIIENIAAITPTPTTSGIKFSSKKLIESEYSNSVNFINGATYNPIPNVMRNFKNKSGTVYVK